MTFAPTLPMSSPYGPTYDSSSTESVGLLPYTHPNLSSHRPPFLEPHMRPPLLNYPLTAGEEAAFPGGYQYNRHYSASVESHMSGGTSIGPFADIPGSSEPYPAWSADRQIPMSTEEIEDIFLDLAQKFGFQKDSMRNMVRPRPRPPQTRAPHHAPYMSYVAESR